MRLKSWLIIMVFISFNAIANMQDSYDQAKQYQNNNRLGNPHQAGNKIIFDQDADISNLSNMAEQDLTSKGGQILSNTTKGQMLHQSEVRKIDALKEYDLNPANSLITNAMKIESNPLKHIEGSSFSSSAKIAKIKTNKTCTEGVEFEIEVIKQLHVETELIDQWGEWQSKNMSISPSDIAASWSKELTKEVYYDQNNWSRATYKGVREEDPSVQAGLKQFVADRLGLDLNSMGNHITVGYAEKEIQIFYFSTIPEIARLHYQYRDKIKKFKEQGEYWQVINEESEQLVERNECHETRRRCLDSGNKVFHNQYHIYRPCWKEQITYSCLSNAKNDCGYLKAQGCQLEKSDCLKKMGNICLIWHRHYLCFTEEKELSSSLKGAKMFCLGGDCHTPTIEQNADITNIAYLAALNEMKKDMQTSPIRVFTGEENSCKKNILNFLNCCSSMQGWARDLGLKQCKPEEKALALKRAKAQCHYIGTYCSKRDPIFRACLTKKSTYCCFNSKLARIFQEQGRIQLGMSFGSVENANCRGLTVEELQRIDFSKLDLGELFADLIDQASSKINKSFPRQLQNQMPKMQQQLPKNNNPNLSY